MKNIVLVNLLVSLFFVSSCNSPNPVETLSAPSFTQPVVTGIFVTGINDPDILSVWGNPSDSYSNNTNYKLKSEKQTFNLAYKIERIVPTIPRDVQFGNPFPNPSNGIQTIQFGLSKKGNVALWLVSARISGDKSTDITSFVGATTLTPNISAAYVFLNEMKQAGYYQVTFSSSQLSVGFYRIYLKVDNILYWHDILLYKEIADLPIGLKP
jgi:hypothetical protein